MRLNKKTSIAAGLALCSLLLGASAARAGHYYESITLDQVAGQRDGTETKVKAWVDGDNSRVEFLSTAGQGWYSAGNYLVTTDGGKNVFLVNPKDETYGRFNMEEMMATLGQAMDMMEQMGGMMKMEFSDLSSEKLLEEAGGTILGHATTHYRYKSHYVMTLKVMGMGQQSTIDMIQDIWSTDDLAAQGFGIWLRADRRLRTGNEDLDELLNQEMSKIKGFPLKMVSEMTTTNKKGKQQQNNSTNEVTVLREESIDGEMFKWPSSYTETEIIPSLEGLQGDQQTDPKGKKKGRLSGLFKKPGDDG